MTRSEISEQNTCRACGWVTGLPHSYLLPSWRGNRAHVLNPNTITTCPVPNTSSVYPTSGTSKSSGFYKCKCSSQLLSCSPPALFREWPLQKWGEKRVLELSADLGSCQGLPTMSLGSHSPHGCLLSHSMWLLAGLRWCHPEDIDGIQLKHGPKHHYQLSILLIPKLTNTLCQYIINCPFLANSYSNFSFPGYPKTKN